MKSLAQLAALVCLISIGFTGCSSSGKSRRETFVPLPKSVVDLVSQATFEVVVAKEPNTSLIFDRDPMEDAPFQKKNDAYVSIGTAFLIGPNRFVTAAHILQIDSPSLLSVLKLRSFDGKIFTPTQVIRYSNFRDLIEFQVDQPDDARTALSVSNEFSPGQTLFSIGNFDGDGISYRSAQTLQSVMEATEGRWKYIRYYSPTSGAIGGPLVNDKGQVVGVLVTRNQNEKMNFGVPISELNRLPTDHAEFYRKKIPFRALPKNVDRDWIFSPSLPKNIEQLTAEARVSLTDLIKTTYAEIAEDKEARYFPKHKGFKSYLRTQEMGSDLGYLVSDPYGSHWRLYEFKPDHEKDLKNSQQLKDYLSRGFIPVIVPLPAGTKIGEFNSDPAKIATAMITNDSLGAFSKKGSDSYLMSVGKPDHVSVWADHLGRTWTAAHWYYHDANFALSTTCTPVPTGSACIVRLGYSLVALEDDYMPQFMNQVMLSYQGSVSQWKNFLAEIDTKVMPLFLKDAHVNYVPSKNVEVQAGHFSFNFPSSKIDNDSKLIVKMGYDPNQELASTILSIDLFPAGDERDWFAIETRYAPTDDDTEKHLTNWQKIERKHSPYDGLPELRKKSDSRTILKVVDLRPKTATEAESASIAICETPTKRSEEQLTQGCDTFVKSLNVSAQKPLENPEVPNQGRDKSDGK